MGIGLKCSRNQMKRHTVAEKWARTGGARLKVRQEESPWVGLRRWSRASTRRKALYAVRTAKARGHEIAWYVWVILGNTFLLGPMHRDGIQDKVQVNYFFFFHEASGTFCCSWKREPFLYGSKNHTQQAQHSLRKIYNQPYKERLC